MSFFLDWFTVHIAGVIQTLAGLIICVMLVFAYRLFFVKSIHSSNDSSGRGGSESNPTLDFIEEKLNKLLIQQSALKVTASSLVASGDISSEQVGDISRLKDILKQKENEILNLRNSNVAATSNTATGATDVSSTAANTSNQVIDQSVQEVKKLNEQLSLYQTQIDDLKSRLSDYEIIVEDIADLQKFKKENELLKGQLSNADIAADIIQAAPEEQPVLTDEEKSLHLADDDTNLNALLAEASAEKLTETADAGEAPTDTTLTENEKSLIDDFSKTQKG